MPSFYLETQVCPQTYTTCVTHIHTFTHIHQNLTITVLHSLNVLPWWKLVERNSRLYSKIKHSCHPLVVTYILTSILADWKVNDKRIDCIVFTVKMKGRKDELRLPQHKLLFLTWKCLQLSSTLLIFSEFQTCDLMSPNIFITSDHLHSNRQGSANKPDLGINLVIH